MPSKPRTAEILAVAEMAQLLGVSKQRVYQIIDTDEAFPAPTAELSVGRIWKRVDVETWAKKTGRL